MNVLLEILGIAIVAIVVARFAAEPWRGRTLNLLKAWVTIRAFWLLFAHQVPDEDGQMVSTGALILKTLSNIDPTTFVLFCLLAAFVKFLGILASMQRWRILLFGQGIELPFKHIFGSFLIGRFIGTFLPSTAGLDGYTLYDASRFSGRTVEATAAKFLEKVIGLSGIFLTFLVALPFGMAMFYAIFESRETANLVALLGVAVCVAVLGGLSILLFFPGIPQWVIEHLPLPGKARLQGIIARVSTAAAAYKTKKLLVLNAFVLSFFVHFTTAAMYYFTALAIGAEGAEFWPVTLGSSIQILATVLSPFTIAGEGIRELAQLLLLQNMIGPAAAVASAALGFWAAEALTLAGAYFWWTRPKDYHPAFCHVNGEQVDYEEAAKAATSLETAEQKRDREAQGGREAPAWALRARAAAGYGLGAGLLAGLLIGLPEALAIARQGFGTEAQVMGYGPVGYALFFGFLGLLGGLALSALPMDEDEMRGWTPSLAWLATLVPFGLAVTVFRLMRDVYQEQMPPPAVLGMVAAAFGTLALLLFFVGPRIFRGPFGTLVKPLPALGLVALLALGGTLYGRAMLPEAPAEEAAAGIPAALADRPNVILVMVDTLRADHLDCYGSDHVPTPNLCRVGTDGGTVFDGFAHASWTKPSTASLLTSLVPSSHQTMSKPSALPEEIETVAEVLQERGYTTGAFVSNTNLTESFGFAQGFDDYHYLGPDYLFGAKESSSKLVLYQILRRVWFMLPLGLQFGDFYQDSAVVNANAFEWLEQRKDDRFFLFLHYMDVHDPYFEHPYNGKGIARASNQHPPLALAEEMQRLYVGEIGYLDENFGHLLAKLEELDVYDDTVIVLTSDHGEEFGEHGGFWHGLTLYDEQIRVPLLVKWKQGEPLAPPESLDRPARLIDVAPTLIQRAGAAVPEAMQGIDLATDPSQLDANDGLVFSEENHEGNVLRAMRTQRWKWIEANEGNPRGLPTEELFDMEADPGETASVLGDEVAMARELKLHADGQQLQAESGRIGESRAADVSAEERAALEALGYVE
jgi:arylsulfatase A-like enzyme/uncharacterized membrane protein YbhN (UPF0104 family)